MTWPMARLMALETRNNSRNKGNNATAPALATSRVSPHALAAAARPTATSKYRPMYSSIEPIKLPVSDHVEPYRPK